MFPSPRETALHILRHPVRPLVAIAEFLLYTGGCASADEVLAELPESVETASASYSPACDFLAPYRPELELLAAGPTAWPGVLPEVLDAEGQPLDDFAVLGLLLGQQVLAKELEQVNSLLCGAERCTLCCTGPDAAMRQEYFAIPLQSAETAHFALPCLHAPEQTLEALADRFSPEGGAVLARHQGGQSLVLPRLTQCPALDAGGRCAIYADRPQVCRKPQIFPYLLEAEPGARPCFRVRNALLAVADCPYVRAYQQEIVAYAAACELEPVFRNNKA